MPSQRPPSYTDAFSHVSSCDYLNMSETMTKATARGPAPITGGRRYLRGRRGGLKDMPNMPLDILLEIFAFLHPQDLLNLARTSRAFRAFLMSRSSSAFWKASRQNIEGLPVPPSFLSEPAYANLLFFPYCHNCLKPNVRDALWAYSARYCKSCEPLMFVGNNLEIIRFLRDIFNSEAPLSQYIIERSTGARRLQCPCYHKPEIDAIREKWSVLKDEQEKEAFRKERKDIVAERRTYSVLLSEWRSLYDLLKIKERSALKKERFEAVKRKLREEGWDDLLNHMDFCDMCRLSELNGVHRPSKLTDKGWKTIRAQVIQFLQNILDKRSATLVEKYTTRLGYLQRALSTYQNHQFMECWPGFASIVQIPAIRSLILDEENAMTYAMFSDAIMLIPNFVRSWRDEQEIVFKEKALLGLSWIDSPPVPLLDLAVIWFDCLECLQTQIRWPDVLSHLCFREVVDQCSPPSDPFEVALSKYVLLREDAPFRGNASCVAFNQHFEQACAIIAGCGMDPYKATYAEMLMQDTYLVCLLCTEPGGQEALNWMSALKHAISHHSAVHTPILEHWKCTVADCDKLAMFRKAFDAYTSSLVPRTNASDFVPGFTDLYIDAYDVSTPSASCDFLPHIESYITRWMDYQKSLFIDKVKFALSTATLDLLDLAVVSFECHLCDRIQIRWPHILAHRCFRKPRKDISERWQEGLYELAVSQSVLPQQDTPYCGVEYSTFGGQLERTRAVILACGKDPEKVTYTEMEDCGARLVCTLCAVPERREVFDWQAAVQHAYTRHGGARAAWERIRPDLELKAKELATLLLRSDGELAKSLSDPDKVLGCAYCSHHANPGAMKGHLYQCHQVQEPSADVHFHIHEDSKPRGAPPVWMYPTSLAHDLAVKVGVRVGKGFLADF